MDASGGSRVALLLLILPGVVAYPSLGASQEAIDCAKELVAKRAVTAKDRVGVLSQLLQRFPGPVEKTNIRLEMAIALQQAGQLDAAMDILRSISGSSEDIARLPVDYLSTVRRRGHSTREEADNRRTYNQLVLGKPSPLVDYAALVESEVLVGLGRRREALGIVSQLAARYDDGDPWLATDQEFVRSQRQRALPWQHSPPFERYYPQRPHRAACIALATEYAADQHAGPAVSSCFGRLVLTYGEALPLDHVVEYARLGAEFFLGKGQGDQAASLVDRAQGLLVEELRRSRDAPVPDGVAYQYVSWPDDVGEVKVGETKTWEQIRQEKIGRLSAQLTAFRRLRRACGSAELVPAVQAAEAASGGANARESSPQEPASGDAMTWAYLAVGVAAGLALGAAGAWLFFRRRSNR